MFGTMWSVLMDQSLALYWMASITKVITRAAKLRMGIFTIAWLTDRPENLNFPVGLVGALMEWKLSELETAHDFA
ncbi:MAG TPA: hypothetical protein DIC61_04600 [Pseudomonas sp.]|nr:hypothetical protein [Pseudomonas sp.]